jgi:hypothetical protein
MAAICWLFDVESAEKISPSNYLRPGLEELFGAVLGADEDGSAAFEVYLGDVLLENLAYSISKVSFEGKRDGPAQEGLAKLV